MIIRVQDKDGRGPWRPGFSKKWIDKSSIAPLPPCVPKEMMNAIDLQTPGFYGYGCLSIDQLRQWILPSEATRLAKLGFGVVEMDEGQLLYSDAWQVIFRRNIPLSVQARPVSWNELMKLVPA